jgi:hypothetical protein
MIDSERLNQRLNLIGNIAVIAGIVFLAVELQQSNQIARASIEMEVKSNFAVINQSIYSDPALAELLEKCVVPDPTLTRVERRQLSAFVFQLVNNWLAIEEAFANSMVTQATYDSVEDNVRFILMTFPGMSSFIQEMLDSFPSFSEGDVFQTIQKQLKEQGRLVDEQGPTTAVN